jgi:plastocyanin
MHAPVAASDAPTGRLSRRAVLGLSGGAVLALLLGACGDDGDGNGSPEAGTEDEPVTAFTIVAENIKWDLDRVIVPAGREITATIDNRDRGIPHNLHVKSSGDPKTELEQGRVTQTLRFAIDEPGRYEFVCDAHPNMTGTIEAV